MMEGGPGDGPLITPVDAASTLALMGLLVGAVTGLSGIIVSLWLCRRRWEHTKLNSDKLAFRPPRRKPTAVKSPGSTGHYLKKSPSPTGAAKNPPGTTSQSPSPTGSQNSNNNINSQVCTPQGSCTPIQTPTSDVTLSIENERDKAEIESSEKMNRNITQLNGGRSSMEGSLGQLVFKLGYHADQNSLTVTVVKCMGLPAKGPHKSTSDPYVKLQLLPDKQHHAKTRVFRNTRDPVFDEDFTFFGITSSQLQKTSLHFIIMSFDRYSRDEVIGEVVFAFSSMSDFEIGNFQQITLLRDINPRSLKIQSQGRGELLVSLCWHPEQCKMIVVVLKARNLPKMDVTGLADPYVKIYLMYNKQRIAKRKTHVKKRTLNPIFNESFTFEIPNGVEGLGKVSLEFAMLDWDRVTKNEVIGRLVIGPDSQKDSLNHWKEVCNSPKRQIADWYRLHE